MKKVAVLVDEGAREPAVMKCLMTAMASARIAPRDIQIVEMDDLEPLLDIKYWIIVGNTLLGQVRPGLKISTAHGRPFIYGSKREELGDTIVVPVYHPAFVIQSGGLDSDRGRELLADLKVFANLILHFQHGGMKKVIAQLPDDCTECDESATRWADDGVGYCETHWDAV